MMAALLLAELVPVQAGVWAYGGSYHMVLVDTLGNRFLVMEISESQAYSIELGLRGLGIGRPLTHDLFLDALRATGWRLSRVEVVDLVGSAYRANLVITNGRQREVLDARPSDAVGLAVRDGCPIFVEDWLLDYFMEQLLSPPKESPGISI